MNKLNKIYYISLILLVFMASSYQSMSKSSFSGERLRQGCYDYIYSIIDSNSEVIISKDFSDLEFNEDNVEASIECKPEQLRGNTNIVLIFKSNSKILRRLEIPTRVKIFADVPVVASNSTLSRGQKISEQDIIIESKEVTNYRQDEIPSASEIIGKKIKHNITAGNIITRSAIEEDMIIHRGDKIDLFVISGAVRIRTGGEALQDATVGSRLRIRREGSQTILQGRVATDGTVTIAAD